MTDINWTITVDDQATPQLEMLAAALRAMTTPLQAVNDEFRRLSGAWPLPRAPHPRALRRARRARRRHLLCATRRRSRP